jgi:glucan phosphoethanolaminetransferase (alkaline phosphatase superfamily)
VKHGGFNSVLFVLVLFLGKGLDLCTTCYAITNGLGYEAGLFSLFLLEHGGWIGLIVVSFLVTSGVALVLVLYQERLVRNNAPHWRFMILGFGAYSCVFVVMIAGVNNLVIILGG